MTGDNSPSENNPPPPLPPNLAQNFRWQALFQKSRQPLFLLNRRRRFLFVNHAWEALTGIPAAEARGLVCVRSMPAELEPRDLIVRALCCPPPDVMRGQSSRVYRLVPGKIPARWMI